MELLPPLAPDVIDRLRALPKVLLHDHLDGGLRPVTLVELAAECGHALPRDEPETLGTWFHETAAAGSLPGYLSTFEHTTAVMQTPAALARVAREAVEDLASDGVVAAEIRFAPELHQKAGLSLDEVVDAVTAGMAEGQQEAARTGRLIRARALLTAMRTGDRSQEVARAVLRHQGKGVAGFDIAGAEDGFPAVRHLPAFELLRQAGAGFTIHAGEAYGPASVWQAVADCGAVRLGHGVRVAEDIAVLKDGTIRLGRIAALVRDRRIALEVCPTSNVMTGTVPSLAQHPIVLLDELRMRVTVNTDNRLMGATSMTRELAELVFAYGWDLSDIERVTVNAAKSLLAPFDERAALIEDVILPSYAAARAWGPLTC